MYLETAGELHHLLGLAVLEAVDASDTVTDGQDATGLLQILVGLLAEDLLLQDAGDLWRAARQLARRGGDRASEHARRSGGDQARVALQHLYTQHTHTQHTHLF